MPIKINKHEKDVYGQSESSNSAGPSAAPASTVPNDSDETANKPSTACRNHVDEAIGGAHELAIGTELG